MTNKRHRVMAYEKTVPPTMVTSNNSHVTNKKNVLSTFTKLIATKLDNLMAYGHGSLRTKSHDSLIT